MPRRWEQILLLALIIPIIVLANVKKSEPATQQIEPQSIMIQENSLLPIVSPVVIISPPEGEPYEIIAKITAYNPVEWQTDSTPHIMASGKYVYEGAIANNCLPFGTIVEIDGKLYVVEDRMNSKYGCGYFDIMMFSYEDALAWGRRTKIVKIYG